MKYLSVCSGIEAASVAWHDFGWEPVAFSEIDAFPAAVLAHRFPNVPNLGDMNEYRNWNIGDVDILVGGTPCQAFSVAGLRRGLEDARGSLSITFVQIADKFNPKYIIWENVPGVLSSKDNAFGCFLGALAGEDCEIRPPGGKWKDSGCVYGPKRAIAWRCLDAQYFNLAQRRKRVFVVSCPRDGADPAEILFEWAGGQGDTVEGGAQGQETPADSGVGSSGSLDEGSGDERTRIDSPPRRSETVGTLACNTGPNGHDAGNFACNQGVDAGYIQAVPQKKRLDSPPKRSVQDYSATSKAENGVLPFDTTQITSASNYSNPKPGDPCHPLASGAHPPAIADSNSQGKPVPFRETADCLTAAYGTKWNGNASADNGSLFVKHQIPETAGCLDTQCGGGKLTHQSIMNGHIIATERAEETNVSTPELSPCLNTKNSNLLGAPRTQAYVEPECMRESGHGYWVKDEISGTLRAEGENRPSRPSHVIKAAFQQNTRDEVRFISGDGQIAGALAAESGAKQTNYILEQTQEALAFDGYNQTLSTTSQTIRTGSDCDKMGMVLLEKEKDVLAFDGYSQTVSDTSQTIRASRSDGDHVGMVFQHMVVRRLTPIECERLQGFPDLWTKIPYRKKDADKCPDGPRYKSLGNSMATNVMRWIGQRVAMKDGGQI